MNHPAVDRQKLHERQEKLHYVQNELKRIFVGIDPIIDEFIHQVRIWYLMPELLTKPIVINLWGMTGVGKTDLVRKFVDFLDFSEHFAEIELANGRSSTYFRYASCVTDILQRYAIQPNHPSILFFDEVQKFRTIDDEKKDIPDLLFQDFWELLSDGKLSKRDQSDEIEEMMLGFLTDMKRQEKDDKATKPMNLSPWDMRRMRKVLGLHRGLQSINTLKNLTPDAALKTIEEQMVTKKIFGSTDYRMALIIISGNLDEAYEMAKQTQEADVDPDIFHAQTAKISFIEIKEALSRRFKPEQVSRFGNIHLIYPSLKKADFQKLIAVKLDDIASRVFEHFQIRVHFEPSVAQLIYDNGVFPVQGVRPVFSAMSDIIESQLSRLLFTCLTQNFNGLLLRYEPYEKHLIATLSQTDQPNLEVTIPYIGRIDRVRQRNTLDLTALTAVHEAGHAIMYALNFGLAPLQLKANLASSSASGFTFSHLLEITRENIVKKTQVLLAGYIAEEIMFGKDQVTAGAATDIEEATRLIADAVRRYGLSAEYPLRIVPETDQYAKISSTQFAETNQNIHEMIREQTTLTHNLLKKRRILLRRLARELLKKSTLTAEEVSTLLTKAGIPCRSEDENFRIISPYAKDLV